MIEPSGYSPNIAQREGVDAELLRQKAYLDELFELAPDAVVLTTLRNPRILRINREFTRMFGYTSDEAVGNRLCNLVLPDDLEPTLPEDPDLLAGRKMEWEVIRQRKDGTRFHAHIVGKRIQLSGDEDAAQLVFRDVSARKQAEALLAGEKRLLEVIAAGAPLATTLDALCRLAEDLDRGSLVSILLVDRHGKQLRHGAGPSLPSSYVDAVDGAPVGLGIGPCAAAAHLDQQVISVDLAADVRWSDEMRALAIAHGLRACWSTPIKSSERQVLGTFAIYPSEPRPPTPEQESRIEQLSHLASIAIERAQSIDALRRSEERYALAMDAAADGHLDWNLLTGESYISPRMLKMVGHAPDAKFADHADWVRRFPFHPEDRPRWESAIAAHFAGPEAKFRGDFRIVVNGETRWQAFNFIATRDVAGNVIRWTGSIADIDDAKRDLATLLDAIPGLVAILTPVGEVDAVNKELIAYCGQPVEAMRQWGTNGTVHSEDLSSVAAVMMHAMSTGEPYAFEARIRCFDGAYRWNQVRGLPFRDSNGRIVRWYVLLSDIDASKRAEEALREQTERLQLGQAAMRMVIMDWNVAEDLLTWSDSPEWLRGPVPASGRYPLFKDQVHPEDRDSFLATRGRALETLQVQTTEFRLVRTDGKVIWVLERKHAFAGAGGNAVRMLAAMFDITDRKRAEGALRRSEAALRLSDERYALAMGVAEEGHFDWNVQTDEVFASEHLKQVLDLPADAEHRTRGDLMAAHIPLHPDDRERIEEMTREVLAGDALNHEFEYRLLRGQGRELRWIHTRWKVFRDGAGVALRIIGVVSDITDRKQAADELRESEARFRALTALWSDWYWRQDEHLRFAYSTAATDPPHGYPGGSAIGKTRWELADIVPLSSSWAEHRELLAARKPFRDFEYSRRARDGTLRYVSTSGTPIFDENGKFRGYHGVARNITERKRVEEELRSRGEMLGMAQKAARAAAFEWQIGAGEGENRWSPDLEAMHGIAAGSYDGTYDSWKKLVQPEDWPSVQAAIEAAQQTGDVDAQYRVLHPAGTIRWLQAIGHMFFDREGKPIRIVGFILDVTDRHLAEEELQRMERQLRQVQRLEALGTLAGGIAHDFNNLLGAILGYGEMALRNVRAGSRMRRDIESIMIAGERGRALVDRILAFSRSGVAERVAVEVEDVVRETLALFVAKLPYGIVVSERLEAARATLMGDATQIHQVLMNLMTNAVQAMPSGGTLRVSLGRTRTETAQVAVTGTIVPDDYIVLEVADTGAGIPPSIVEKIFDPFFTTKEAGVGTGLGLSLVHGIVTGLGGVIDLATILGQGTVFKVYLPCSGVAASAPRRTTVRKVRMGRGDRERILVVDDEASLVTLATETLSERGYAPVGFTSSAAALAAFVAEPDRFDAVLTDESMPGMSGAELIRKIRAVKPRVPIVLVTGLANPSVVQRVKDAGATEVLRKPLSSRQLAISIERVLLQSRSADACKTADSPSPLPVRAVQPRRGGASSRVGPRRG